MTKSKRLRAYSSGGLALAQPRGARRTYALIHSHADAVVLDCRPGDGTRLRPEEERGAGLDHLEPGRDPEHRGRSRQSDVDHSRDGVWLPGAPGVVRKLSNDGHQRD